MKDPKKTYYVCGIAVRYDNDEANVDTSGMSIWGSFILFIILCIRLTVLDGIPVTDVKIQGAPWLAGFGKGDFLAIGISTGRFHSISFAWFYYILTVFRILRNVFAAPAQDLRAVVRWIQIEMRSDESIGGFSDR